MKTPIGFIGLGMMGHGMASNILNKGYPLSVVAHRNRKPIDDLVGRGAREVVSTAELVEMSDIIFFCVRGAEEVERLVYDENGLLDNCRPGIILVDCTTSSPVLSKRIATDLENRQAAFVDAPVTRAPQDAEAGRLNSLVGAAPKVFETVKPILDCYSENISYFGPPGAGHSAKLINNFISCGYTALIAEGLSLCFKAGVDAHTLYQVMSTGGADSGVLRKMVPPLLQGDLTGHRFTLSNACKDVGYFKTFAEGFGFSSYLADSLHKTYKSAVDAGLGDKMMASLMELHDVSGSDK
ncbi:MAG: NAD(P)-dependent oxidoreductase [Desulfofustis sp.]|nr:NAD(P)-dependent oxidoreductase [Desulfofustis sp.]